METILVLQVSNKKITFLIFKMVISTKIKNLKCTNRLIKKTTILKKLLSLKKNTIKPLFYSYICSLKTTISVQ